MFLIPFMLMAVASYQEVMFERMLEGYSKKEEPTPKGYYKCVDCGMVCERINASQKRCAECQKEHRRKLEKERKQKK